jgi:hypothetical protein
VRQRVAGKSFREHQRSHQHHHRNAQRVENILEGDRRERADGGELAADHHRLGALAGHRPKEGEVAHRVAGDERGERIAHAEVLRFFHAQAPRGAANQEPEAGQHQDPAKAAAGSPNALHHRFHACHSKRVYKQRQAGHGSHNSRDSGHSVNTI